MWEATVVVSKGAKRCRVDVASLEAYKRAGWKYVADGDPGDGRKIESAELKRLSDENLAEQMEASDKAARTGKTTVAMSAQSAPKQVK